jgi:hypothetical protein
MVSGWIRAFVFVAMTALIANAHCFGNCASEACSSTKAPSNSCHHKKSPDRDTARCWHQHSVFAAPEAGITKPNVETANAVLPAPSTVAGTVLPEPVFGSRSEIGSLPCHVLSFTTSVLRI